jgi:hopene-associated glycosyltransferase HpnB
MLQILSLLTFVIWLVIFFLWGQFWRVWEFDADRARFPSRDRWPTVAAVVPARNEAETIGAVLRGLAAQDYSGEFSIVIVDDHSHDGTAGIARRTAEEAGVASRTIIVRASELQPGWTGKLWSLNLGANVAADMTPEFLWFTDADIMHSTDTLRNLVSNAESGKLDLTSLMVLLKAESFVERLLIPPFVYFFLMLYPPRWIADSKSKTAGAAGGCILLRRSSLERAGGLAAIRGEVIDDCALARIVKKSGGKIWMGLTRSSRSMRAYTTLSEIRDVIARTAFTQLRYSALNLLGTLLGLGVTFLVPFVLTFSSNIHVWPFALAAWCLMTASFLPAVTLYRLSPVWAPLLPFSALFYAFATCLSAVRYWLGRGGQWKGRAQASKPISQ